MFNERQKNQKIILSAKKSQNILYSTRKSQKIHPLERLTFPQYFSHQTGPMRARNCALLAAWQCPSSRGFPTIRHAPCALGLSCVNIKGETDLFKQMKTMVFLILNNIKWCVGGFSRNHELLHEFTISFIFSISWF